MSFMEARERIQSTGSLGYSLMKLFEFNRVCKQWIGRIVHCCNESQTTETENPRFFDQSHLLYLVPYKFPYAIRFSRKHLLLQDSLQHIDALLKRLNVLQRIKLVRSRLESKSIFKSNNNRNMKNPNCSGQIKISQVCMMKNTIFLESFHQFELDTQVTGKKMVSCLAEPSSYRLQVSGACSLLRFQLDYKTLSKTHNCLVQVDAEDLQGFHGLFFCGVNLKSGFYLKLFFKPDPQADPTASYNLHKQALERNIQLQLIALRVEFRPSGDPTKADGSVHADNSRTFEQHIAAAENKQPATILGLPISDHLHRGQVLKTLECRVHGQRESTINDTSNYRFNIIVRPSAEGVQERPIYFRGHPTIHSSQKLTSQELFVFPISRDHHFKCPQVDSRTHQVSGHTQRSAWLNMTAESKPRTTFNSLESCYQRPEVENEPQFQSSKHTYFEELDQTQSVSNPPKTPAPAKDLHPVSKGSGDTPTIERSRGFAPKTSRVVRPGQVLATASEASDLKYIYLQHTTTKKHSAQDDFYPGFSAKFTGEI